MTTISDRFSTAGVGAFLDGYFERTLELTGEEAPIDFEDAGFVSYFLTNEPAYASVLGEIEGRGGAFIGVGQAVPITYAAWQVSSSVYIVEKDASIPLGFTPLLGALLLMAPTRADFLALTLARPIPTTDGPWRDVELVGYDLLRHIGRIPYDPVFAGTIDEMMAQALEARVPPSMRDGVRRAVLMGLDRFRDFPLGREAPIWNLGRYDGEGRGGLLFDEASYRRHRELFLEDRVTGVVADMTSSAMHLFAKKLEAMGEEAGVVYLSNVEDWIFDEALKTNVYHPLHAFYDNLLALPGAANAAVVGAIDQLHTRVEGLASYVERAIPIDLPAEQAGKIAAAFVEARVLLHRMELNSFPARKGRFLPEKLFGADTNGVGAVAKLQQILDGPTIAAEEFHRRMLEASEAYRGLSPSEQGLLLRNLEHAGALERPRRFTGVIDAPGGGQTPPETGPASETDGGGAASGSDPATGAGASSSAVPAAVSSPLTSASLPL